MSYIDESESKRLRKGSVGHETKHTVCVFSITLGKLCVMSTHGLMSTAPEGMGKPMSLMTVSAARHSAPPAESPANTSLDAGTGLCAAPGGGAVR